MAIFCGGFFKNGIIISMRLPQTKFIFITGGVVSGIGKGITTASLGFILKARGLKVVPVKIDPYLNRDAGTMNPFQHGEVFVTNDGAETDLDLGHYERFMDMNLSRLSNFTTGAVYEAVISEERKGSYLGKTIQIIPHVTDEIKRRIREAAKINNPDVVIVEVGGTVGDIEGQPFLESLRQFRQEVGQENSIFIHVVKIDYIYPSDEEKTKPIQQSITLLRSFGIQPDLLIVRCKRPFAKVARDKISLFGGVGEEQVIQAEDATNIYDIPLNLEHAGLGKQIMKLLYLSGREPDFSQWQELVGKMKNASKEITVGFVGKYLDHPDAYISVLEALRHAAAHLDVHINIQAVDSEKSDIGSELSQVDGILVPGGFGSRGIEGKVKAVQFARENRIPYLGLCLGLQVGVIEFARNVCGLQLAHSTEFDKDTSDPVVDFLPEQRGLDKKGGTMRLGLYENILDKGSLVAKLYGQEKISERHRHRFEVNPEYHKILSGRGLEFSGWYKDLVEFIELPENVHPFFVATQSHPEFTSRVIRPNPLFYGFVRSMREFSDGAVRAESKNKTRRTYSSRYRDGKATEE